VKEGQKPPTNPSILLGQYSQFVNDRKNWDDVRNVLTHRDTPADKFFAVIPRLVAEFALLLRTPVTYQALAGSAPAELASQLTAAKQMADKYFQGIEEHPAVLGVMMDRLQATAARRGQAPSSMTALTEFTEFHATPLWMEGDDVLAPAVAIALMSGNRFLMKVTVDWDDLSFLSWATTNLLRNELSRAQKMAKKQSVDMPFKETLGERIAEMTKMLEEINDLAAALDIVVKDGPKSDAKG
jgi:hypothetical protein